MGHWKNEVHIKICRNYRCPNFQTVYVSLNGLKSVEDIDRELFRVMHTVMGHRLFEAAASIAKSAAKAVKGLTIDVNFIDLVNKYTAALYVFDDLERCSLPSAQVLGYINGFVEQGRRKVIVIGNDEEIKDLAEFNLIREKVIGMTFRFNSVVDEALPSFIESIGDKKTSKFLKSKIDIVKSIHQQAEKENLRVLQQALWDFERFYMAIESKHRENDDAMTAALRFILALAMDVRSGRLDESDLRDRQSSIVGSMVSRQAPALPSRILESRRRYPASDVGGSMLSDDTLVAMFIKGTFDDAISKDLNASSYFVDVTSEPEWRTLWHGIERTEDEVIDALAEVRACFEQREYTKPGEILHVFGLLIRHADIGDIGMSRQDVVTQCQQYVDDLYKQGRLGPPSDDGKPRLRETGYGGLQIASSDTPEYRRLFSYLEQVQAKVASDRYPAISQELLETLRDAPAEFVSEIAPGSGQYSKYSKIPILSYINPKDFVSIWLCIHPGLQRQVLDALTTRYEHHKLNDDLSGELGWANSVYAEIISSVQAMSPHGRYRTRIFLEYSLDRVPELILPAPPAPPAPGAPV